MHAYYIELARATNLETVWDLHCRTMRSYGFDRLLYGYTQYGGVDSIGEIDDAMILSNHSEEYMASYIWKDMIISAPLTQWASEHVGAMAWGKVWGDTARLTETQRQIIEFNRKMGVRAGYTISFFVPRPKCRAAISLAARKDMSQNDIDEVWALHGVAIEAMNHMVHLKIASLPYEMARQKITMRQREVLEWVANGKSNRDVATIMGLSLTTVEKHLRQARERLGVETTAQAILKVAFQKQIFVL